MGEGSEHRADSTQLAHLGPELQTSGTLPLALESGRLAGSITFFINITR